MITVKWILNALNRQHGKAPHIIHAHRKKARPVFLLIALLLLSGCSSTGVMVNHIDRESKPSPKAKIDVYDTIEAVQRPYKEFAILTATDKRSINFKEEKLRERIINRAKEMGADAVIINRVTRQNKYVTDGMGGYVTYAQLQVEAVAILYKNE